MKEHKQRHKQRQKPQRQQLRREELNAIVEQTRGALSPADYEALKSAVDTLAFLTQELEAKGASLQRLRHMLFGAPTEKTGKVLGDEPPKDPPPGSDTAGTSATGSSDEEGKATGNREKPATAGHGRNGAASYTGAKRIKVAHPSLKKGDSCPACFKGKVYTMAEPAVIVRIVGMAPLSATMHQGHRI